MLPFSKESGKPKLAARTIPFRRALFLPLLALMSVSSALTQQSTPSPPPDSPPASSDAAPKQDHKPAVAPDAKQMTPEEARQAQLVADTNRLYQLAQELQAEVAKSSKNTLSLAVVKKAAEVEKLARSLKERMKPE